MNEKGVVKKGQVWIETVIYLLIAFVMIGLVLSFVRPNIEELRDKSIIEQSIKMLNDLDNVILTIGSPGNQRLIEAGIRKGELKFNGTGDFFIFEIESSFIYSEPGEVIGVGNVLVKTEEQTRHNLVTLISNYSGVYNLTYQGEENVKTFSSSSTQYNLLVTNKGEDLNKKTVIDIDLV